MIPTIRPKCIVAGCHNKAVPEGSYCSECIWRWNEPMTEATHHHHDDSGRLEVSEAQIRADLDHAYIDYNRALDHRLIAGKKYDETRSKEDAAACETLNRETKMLSDIINVLNRKLRDIRAHKRAQPALCGTTYP